MTQFQSVAELYAHAIAVESEAAARYAELGQYMEDLGNDLVGDLFLRFARLGNAHEAELRRRAAGMQLPQLAPGEYAWIDVAAPQTAAHEFVLHLLTPHGALEIALAAERSAEAFFEAVESQSRDPAVVALAAEMADEEREHVSRVEGLIARTPETGIDWSKVFG